MTDERHEKFSGDHDANRRAFLSTVVIGIAAGSAATATAAAETAAAPLPDARPPSMTGVWIKRGGAWESA